MQNLALVSLRYSQVAAVGGLQGDDSTMLPREPWFTQPAGDNGIAPGPLTLVIGIQIAANFLGPRTLALEWYILEPGPSLGLHGSWPAKRLVLHFLLAGRLGSHWQ